MKKCPFCHAELEDSVRFCRACGTAQPGPDYLTSGSDYEIPENVTAEPEISPYDHTAEYEAADVEQHKLYAMLVYVLGIVGVIVDMLGAKESEYTAFHVRQGLKLIVLDGLIALVTVPLFWTRVVPVLALVCLGVLCVVRVICFVRVCKGKAVEAPIIRNFSFLK